MPEHIVAEADHEFMACTKAKIHGPVDRMVAEADKTT